MPHLGSSSKTELVECTSSRQILGGACDVAELSVTQTLSEDIADLLGDVQAYLTQFTRPHPVSPRTGDPAEGAHRHSLAAAVARAAARRDRFFQDGVPTIKVALKRQAESQIDEGADNPHCILRRPDNGECRFVTCYGGCKVNLAVACQEAS